MVAVCSHCRTVNRVPDERAAQDPVWPLRLTLLDWATRSN